MKTSIIRKLPPIVFLGLCFLTPGLSAQSLTIEQCQEMARKNYPLIKQLDLVEKSMEFNISNANKAYLPQISITAIEGYIINGLPAQVPGAASDNGNFKFIGIGQINQTLWDGGATRVQKDMIRTNVDIEKASIEVSLYTVKERVNQLFFGILVMDEQLNALELHKQNLQRNINKVKTSVENGLAYTSDADEVKVELLKLEQRQDEFLYTRKTYKAMLGVMIGQLLNDNQPLEKPAIDAVLPEAINRPEIALYNFQRQQAGQHNSMSRVGYMPKVGALAFGVGLTPGAMFGNQTIQSLSLAGISLSWNTMGLYRDRNNKDQTKLNLERIQNQQETFLFNTHLQLSQQTNEIEKQRAVIAKDVEIIALRTSIKKAYELKYQNGVCSVHDLIQAVNAESEASSNKALHEVQLMLNFYNYKTTSGN